MLQVELGVGDNPRIDPRATHYVGLDASEAALRRCQLPLQIEARLLRCTLGFEPIPLPDRCADLVLGDQFLEHVPRIGYRLQGGALVAFNPLIEVLNETCRIARPGALVQFHVPRWNSEEQHQDPTHMSAIPPAFWKYWDPRDPWQLKHSYGIRGSLELLGMEERGWYHVFRLRAVG